ncbi:hypothetical protein BN159_2642 [Streptomyces davaonensis JCM 4913]|uniref:SnoaL-like domain-containing protein n=1 Tax=Streptomyces davaonensis (strain DSM 101723 / JCM 4913 / KCC S-0913 / 768) TaxID=1214101 RepID=K4QTU7_STRDJ|nr:hypothetical protein [Streptomyces davaonensis]CCK27021.1 hypothetical protein BN159_2642 [Streptomyces davaonensis JCM 4913]
MSETENTRLMERIFAGLAKGDGMPLADSLADDFRWTIIGTTSWSGTYEGKQTVLKELFRPLLAQFADTYTNTHNDSSPRAITSSWSAAGAPPRRTGSRTTTRIAGCAISRTANCGRSPSTATPT